MSGNLAVMGPRDTVLPFCATGARVEFVTEADCRETLQRLVREGVQVVFFAEEFIPLLADILREYQKSAFPCVIPFPTGRTDRALAIDRVRGIIKRAVGADVFVETK